MEVFEIDTIIVSANRLRGSTATGHTVLLKEATAMHSFCNNAWVVGTCQSNIHVDPRFPSRTPSKPTHCFHQLAASQISDVAIHRDVKACSSDRAAFFHCSMVFF